MSPYDRLSDAASTVPTSSFGRSSQTKSTRGPRKSDMPKFRLMEEDLRKTDSVLDTLSSRDSVVSDSRKSIKSSSQKMVLVHFCNEYGLRDGSESGPSSPNSAKSADDGEFMDPGQREISQRELKKVNFSTEHHLHPLIGPKVERVLPIDLYSDGRSCGGSNSLRLLSNALDTRWFILIFKTHSGARKSVSLQNRKRALKIDYKEGDLDLTTSVEECSSTNHIHQLPPLQSSRILFYTFVEWLPKNLEEFLNNPIDCIGGVNPSTSQQLLSLDIAKKRQSIDEEDTHEEDKCDDNLVPICTYVGSLRMSMDDFQRCLESKRFDASRSDSFTEDL